MKAIVEILSEAEMKLQNVIAIAAKDGDYQAIDLARRYAVQLHEMQNALNNAKVPSPKIIINNEEVSKTSSVNTTKKKQRCKKAEYPRYEIEHNTLVRVGWSKKEKKEYNHKVSKNIYDLTVVAMEKLSNATAGPFMAEDIIAKLNRDSQQAIPAYQIYVVIGYLKERSCINQIGREGYSIPKDIMKRANEIWC